MDEQTRQENERIRKLVVEAQMMQVKRTMKALSVLMILYFAVQGALAIYQYFLR